MPAQITAAVAAAGFPVLGWSALMLSDEPANVAVVMAGSFRVASPSAGVLSRTCR